MKQLVVNADDFGLTESTNQGIAEAHSNGILTSSTLLANGAAFDSAVALALGLPRLGVGVHLNLTEGRPVAHPSTIVSLVDGRGCFFASPFALAARLLTRQVRTDDVERELGAQIEKVRAAGIAITHLDGHKHVHMLPGIFPVVVRLARRFGIPGVRLARERSPLLAPLLRRNAAAAGRILRQRVQAHALGLLAWGARKQLRGARIAYPEHFYGITQTGFLDGPELETVLQSLPEGLSELMCHPGYADCALRGTGTRLVEERQRELEALTRPEIRNVVAVLGVRLINYGALRVA